MDILLNAETCVVNVHKKTSVTKRNKKRNKMTFATFVLQPVTTLLVSHTNQYQWCVSLPGDKSMRTVILADAGGSVDVIPVWCVFLPGDKSMRTVVLADAGGGVDVIPIWCVFLPGDKSTHTVVLANAGGSVDVKRDGGEVLPHVAPPSPNRQTALQQLILWRFIRCFVWQLGHGDLSEINLLLLLVLLLLC